MGVADEPGDGEADALGDALPAIQLRVIERPLQSLTFAEPQSTTWQHGAELMDSGLVPSNFDTMPEHGAAYTPTTELLFPMPE